MQVQVARPIGALVLSTLAALLMASGSSAGAQAHDRSLQSTAPMSTWERVTDLPSWQQPEGHWRLTGSPYTHHWRLSDEHRHVFALGIERQYSDRYLLGGSLFRNSFGQPSAFAYVGRRTDGLLDRPHLFVQWSAGIIYGYRGKYQSKLPLNVSGFAPGVLVSLGWQYDKQLSLTAHALGDAGVLLQLAYDLR